ncbi:MAG: VTT domain-containing protein [bacterium]|nr:VTT domain-containing protein [bacterium]
MVIRITPVNIALVAVFIGLPILLWTNEMLFVRWFSGTSGLLAITVLAFIGNFTILFPAPALGLIMPIVSRLAEQNGLVLISALYALGSALGETSGYLAGRKGADIPFFGDSKWHQALEGWLRGKKTDVALLILSAFPVILPFDVAGIIAGSMRHPWWRFVASTFFGRLIKYVMFIQMWQTVDNLSGYFAWAVFTCVFVGSWIIVLRYRKTLWMYLSVFWMNVRTRRIRIKLAWA